MSSERLDTFTVEIDYIYGTFHSWQWTVNHHGKGRILRGTTITKGGAHRAAKRAIRSWLRDRPVAYTYRECDL